MPSLPDFAPYPLLARFALLAMTHIADRPAIERMIDAAADGVGPPDNNPRRLS